MRTDRFPLKARERELVEAILYVLYFYLVKDVSGLLSALKMLPAPQGLLTATAAADLLFIWLRSRWSWRRRTPVRDIPSFAVCCELSIALGSVRMPSGGYATWRPTRAAPRF